MNRYAMVRDGATESIILWDGVSPYAPPPGCTLDDLKNASDVAEAAVLAATTIEAVDAVRPEWP